MQGLKLRHLATFTSSLFQKEKLEWVEGFLQDKEWTAQAGSPPGSPAIQTFAISSVFSWLLVHELISTADGGSCPWVHLTRWSICNFRD